MIAGRQSRDRELNAAAGVTMSTRYDDAWKEWIGCMRKQVLGDPVM